MRAEHPVTYASLLDSDALHREYEQALERIARELGHHHPMYINGRRVAAIEEFETRSPIDADIIIGTFQKGGPNEAQSAIEAAAASFLTWGRTEWRARVETIRTIAASIERDASDLAALITYEVGKNRFEALAEVYEAVAMLRYNCDAYEAHNGFVTPMARITGEQSVSVMKPYGAWAVISPFNFPLVLAAGMLSAALLAGNTVVFKPTSKAPLTGLKLYTICVKGGIPGGVLNIITGPGEPFGEVVTRHRDIAGIAFTGSRAAGAWLQRAFENNQSYIKPFIGEMGSKNPVIVTARAEIEVAVEGVIKAAFGYGGQKCSAASRVYVDKSVASEFIDQLRARSEALTVGDPRRRDVVVGPLIDLGAREKFERAIADAQDDGGTVIAGGTVLHEGLHDRGAYVRPTVITGLSRTHRLFVEELFVPLVVVDTISSLEEGIEQANATEYGLTAGIFSKDEGEIERFFASMNFGVCYANRRGGATTGAWPGVQAFGGWKASGSTGKGVGGPYYLLSYVREQTQTRA
ncbi:MAG: aldehyde dehydrogenase family protein [Halobacteriota archaeon]